MSSRVHPLLPEIKVIKEISCLCTGVDESAVSMGRVCGSTTRDFYSPGINVFIKFHSDASNNGRGFQLAYQEVPVSSRIPAGELTDIIMVNDRFNDEVCSCICWCVYGVI